MRAENAVDIEVTDSIEFTVKGSAREYGQQRGGDGNGNVYTRDYVYLPDDTEEFSDWKLQGHIVTREDGTRFIQSPQGSHVLELRPSPEGSYQ